MKKYIIYLIALLFPFTIYAFDISLDNKIIEFPSIKDYSLQGFTTVEDKIFMVFNSYDEKAIIKVYSLKSNKEIYTKELESLGHANDVTYNNQNNTITVIAGGGQKTIYIFSSKDYSFLEEKEIDYPSRSITYLEDLNKYAIRTVTLGYLLNEDYTPTNYLPFISGMNIQSNLGRQGWAYYQEHIYYTNWSWIRLGGDGKNIIYIYNLNGKLQDYLVTPENIGEIEDISFYQDKMILGFNGYDDKIKFYLEDIPPISKEEEEKIEETTIEESSYNKKTIYIYIIIPIIFILILLILKHLTNKKSTS